jgi:hypothetical protein
MVAFRSMMIGSRSMMVGRRTSTARFRGAKTSAPR